ncbi:AAA domain, putative AbiEii toxin, Type IV TA system [Propionibacterium ruminifibrarum]|uniref:AAA domain, putative AbiEii toxin, Type IV TA system n=1 Tax=Propionibacterium ruminifibrarum TaxID=1962131 RepID=A0A375I7A1_9ACTN|nr:AAA family ATPase [Propionibacterium ruminifibrarum]SPF69136.1 AAA domain, putative AbiEii toxin, Type IV TA system [Propionibacterium ruminifibrarum]
MVVRLGRLVVEGLGSIRHLELDLTSDVTVLIGANGSGKSNLVSALELVSRIWDDSFQEYLRQRGGVGSLLYAGDDGRAEQILIELLSEVGTADSDSVAMRNGYRVTLRPDEVGDTERVEIREWLLFCDMENDKEPYAEDMGSGIHSIIRDVTDPGPAGKFRNFAGNVRPIGADCRVFHFDDVSANAPVQGWSTIGDDAALHSDAENIAAYLYRLREEHPKNYQRIVSVVRHVTPFFDDFVLKPDSAERIRLQWKQRGLDRTFRASEASDGTLRFICLTTLLLSPDLPATVILDEPELGLHPAAIGLLAELTRIAGRTGHKVILATQSVPLVSHFELGEIAVLDRVNGTTQATRPNEEFLKPFLDDYSTGNLWEMNLLGGHPSAGEAPNEGEHRFR